MRIRKNIASLSLLAGAPLLAGCMPSAQEQRSQFMETPSLNRTIANSGVRSVSEKGWPSPQWWRNFRSPELDRIVDKALNDNQNLRKAADTLKEAEAGVQIASSRLTPYLEMDLAFKQYRYADKGVAASLNPLQGGLNKSASFLNPISAKWELDFWGKNRALLDAAIGDSLAQQG